MGWPLRTRAVQRYLAALALALTAATVRLMFFQVLETRATWVMFYPVVMIAALYGGLGPGLLATAVSALLGDCLWIEPVGQITLKEFADGFSVGMFTVNGALISWVAEALRRAQQRKAAAETEAQVALALRASDARLAGFVSAMFEGVVESEAGRIVDCNEQFAQMVGYSVAELTNMAITDLIPAEDRQRVLANITQYRDSVIEHAVLRKDGSRMAVEAHGRSGAADSTRRYTAIRDISERKRIEGRLATDLAALTRMHYLSARLMEPSELQALLQEVMEAAVAVAGAQRGTLQLLQGDALRIVAQHGHQQPFLDFFAEAEKRVSACGAALQHGQRVVVPDVEDSPVFAGTPSLAVLRAAGVRAVQSTPMVSRKGSLLGILTTHWGEPHNPNEHELWRIDLLARQAADLIEHAAAEAAVRESEDRFRTLANAIPQLAWIANADGYLFWYNQRWYEYTGTTPDQMQGWGWQSVHDPKELPKVLERWKASLASGEPFDMTFPLRGGDGIFRPFLTRVMPLKDAQGRVQQWFGTNTDVTEQRRAAEEREITVQFLRLINSSSDARHLVEAAVRFFHEQSGCEAVGIRLRDGDDYPYYESRGFPAEFLQAENSLCSRDPDGRTQRDYAGNPVLACMCGNVLGGRFDPNQPFFTIGGSFWSNDTTRLLATCGEADLQSRTRNRCNGEGYESVALVPIRSGAGALGLLQLNDHRKGMFTANAVAHWERLAGYLGVALAKAHAEESLKASLAEKEVLLKEIHHRVKNNMQVISSLVALQAERLQDGAMGDTLRDVSHRVRSMALVHEKLYQSADMARVEFAEYVESLLKYLWRAHGAAAADVRLALDLQPVSLSVNAAVPCGLILNELASNALKHAFRQEAASGEQGTGSKERGEKSEEVRVALRTEGSGRVCLRIADNGAGLPPGLDWRRAESLGLRLVQMLAGQLDARVELGNGRGTEFTVTFMAK
jgi:PAS domain S-box-containing protein